jgi:hypothetical protein
MEDLADADSERHRPPLAALGLPVGGNDRGTGQVKAAGEVEIHEGLDQTVVVRAADPAVGKRPDIVDQGTIDPRIALLKGQHNHRRAEAPILVAEVVVVVGRNLDHRPGAPNPVPGLGRREEGRENRVADAVGPLAIREWLRDDRDDGARDDVPALIHRHWNHRLDIEDVLRPLVPPGIKIGVVLEWHADQVTDWVLGDLGQFFGAEFGMGRRGGAGGKRDEARCQFQEPGSHLFSLIKKFATKSPSTAAILS